MVFQVLRVRLLSGRTWRQCSWTSSRRKRLTSATSTSWWVRQRQRYFSVLVTDFLAIVVGYYVTSVKSELGSYRIVNVISKLIASSNFVIFFQGWSLIYICAYKDIILTFLSSLFFSFPNFRCILNDKLKRKKCIHNFILISYFLDTFLDRKRRCWTDEENRGEGGRG